MGDKFVIFQKYYGRGDHQLKAEDCNMDGKSNISNGKVTKQDITPQTIQTKRRLYTVDALNKAYPFPNTPQHSLKSLIKKKCQCTCPKALETLLGYFPIIGVVKDYKWRRDLFIDFMAGISVAFLQLPQGLALGLLASLPPVYGLYTTLFPVIIYTIFGTCRHMSIGTNAVTALLTASIIAKEMNFHTESLNKELSQTVETSTVAGGVTSTSLSTIATDASLPFNELQFKVGVAAAVSFLSGIFMTAAGLLKFGFVTSYLSSSFVGGFTTAAAFHILTSQVSKLLNIRITPYSGAGKIVKTYIAIFKNIENSNPGDAVVSVVSVVFLLMVTIFVNERHKEKLKVPVPVQLILVVISTLISHFTQLHQRFGVAVVGDIPTGLPAPSLPRMDSLGRVASDSFVVAVLTFTISISLVKLTAKTHNYSVNDNSELMAYGLSNFISSFFSCFTSCNAPPRAMILSTVGAKSTLNSVFCAIFILITLLVAGPLFHSLPVAVLAAMICVAMKNILLQALQLPYLWRTSKPDFVIWLLTCLVSILADLEIGIIAGILISLLTVIIKSQMVSGYVGARSTFEDSLYLSKKREGMKTYENFTIFYFPTQLYFATAEKFKTSIFSKVANPETLDDIKDNAEIPIQDNAENPIREDPDIKDEASTPISINSNSLRYIVLECSAMSYMDMTGAAMLKWVANSYCRKGITLLLTNCPEYSLHLLNRTGYFDDMSSDTVFYDIHDAVSFIQSSSFSSYPI